jgi:dGTPase
MNRAPYAADPQRSRGRQFSTDTSATRSEFQRDRDRIIHSTAFRRLQHKTQVFLHHEGRHYRNRLTHTLEVSQMARSIARALALDEDLAEAVALAHDLGHTPFGHAGERALDRVMQPFGGFDHNAQALRVVTMLENRYAEHDGLNLTWETREGILKHNGPLDPGAMARGGLAGVPQVESLEIATHASLEAQAAAIADDIAYNAHDIDDALRAGLITLADLEEVPLVGPLVAELSRRYPDVPDKRRGHELQRRLITGAIEDVIGHSERQIAAVEPQSVEDVRRAGRTLIGFSESFAAAEKGLKAFLYERVYRHPSVMAPVRDSEALTERLFAHYLADGGMPERWMEAAEAAGDTAGRARVVSDFVAGMTDPYAIDEYARLFDHRYDFG